MLFNLYSASVFKEKPAVSPLKDKVVKQTSFQKKGTEKLVLKKQETSRRMTREAEAPEEMDRVLENLAWTLPKEEKIDLAEHS